MNICKQKTLLSGPLILVPKLAPGCFHDELLFSGHLYLADADSSCYFIQCRLCIGLCLWNANLIEMIQHKAA